MVVDKNTQNTKREKRLFQLCTCDTQLMLFSNTGMSNYFATYRCDIYHSFVQPPCADLDAGAENLEMFLNPSKVSFKLYLIQVVIF